MQNTQIDHAEVASGTVSVSFSTDLSGCVGFVDWVGIFLEHVCRKYKTKSVLSILIDIMSSVCFYFIATVLHPAIDNTHNSFCR